MGDHRLETGDNPAYIHGDDDDCRVCADNRARDAQSVDTSELDRQKVAAADKGTGPDNPYARKRLWESPEEVEARETASLSSYTDVPIPEIQDAIDALAEGESNASSAVAIDADDGTGAIPAVTSWDEVGLGVPDTSGGSVDVGNEYPSVEYGGPTIDAPTDIDYASLAATNPGPTPQLPPLFYEPSEFSDDDTVVSGNDEYDEEDVGEAATAEANDFFPFGLSKTAVLTDEEVRELVANRIREVEVERVKKELALWEAMITEAPTNSAQASVNGYRILHANYIESFQQTFGGER